ncbi:hypothetical protein V6N12_065897 [Hibiscus sabdariffa]|uniref:Uncharacterized protein n=1 Tax=Hibiscus sabdariffa TaxID=183260 RepID=A0ABR2AUI1_9ROSI
MTAIEKMAGMDVLCSDKTGTLTLNKLMDGEEAEERRERAASSFHRVSFILGANKPPSLCHHCLWCSSCSCRCIAAFFSAVGVVVSLVLSSLSICATALVELPWPHEGSENPSSQG